MRSVLLGAAAAAIFVATTHGQSILGPPSEANHFIETPKGWVHPKTPWGEPDIQATLNMMQAASVPLERCANSYRFGGPPCDMNKAWWTEEEYKQRIAAARWPRRPGPRADREGRVRPRAAHRRHRPGHAAAADQPHRRSAERTAARRSRPKAKRRALEMGSSWSLPGEDPVYDDAARLRLLGQLPLARHALVDDAVSLQRRLQDLAGAGRGRLRPRDDPRRARHLHRRPAAAGVRAQAVHGRVARPLGRQHARRRDDELQGRPADDQPRRRRVAGGQPLPGQRPDEDDGADHAAERRHVALRDQDRGSGRSSRGPFTVRYPMRNDPTYEWWEYACHEGNTIVQNYSETNRYERDHPPVRSRQRRPRR